MTGYRDFHRRSIDVRDAFWAEQAKLVHWEKPFAKVLDYSRPPFAKWFVGGMTNLCYNAVDRHLAARGKQKALVYVSTELDEEKSLRKARCGSLGRLRRLCRGEPRCANRRRTTQVDGHRGRRQPHGQAGAIQGAGRRIDQAR
jgi:hypothetical protein